MSDPSPRTEHYFLSYSRSDDAFAMRLARDLRERGIDIWVDQLDIRPSEHWDRAIERAVRDCRGIVVVLSPRSVASDNVADEISFAIDSGKSVLPVMIERCTLPLRITRMQVVDGTGNYETALRQCVDELRRAAPAQPKRQEPHRRLEPQAVAEAKRRLAALMGPIAGVLVDKAAQRARSSDELYRLLSQHIEEAADRDRFLASVAAPPAAEPSAAERQEASVPPADIDAIARSLARYLGPIAPILARREAAGCASPDELKQRLSPLIPTESERSQFLRD